MLTPKIILDYVSAQFKLKYKSDDLYTVNYSDLNKQSKININSSGLNFLTGKEAMPDKIFFKNIYDQRIPFLFGDEQKDIVTSENDLIHINGDIIASAFYFLSGWQEKFSNERDEFDRFPYKESIQKRYDFQIIPVVNYYFLILKDAIEKAYGVNLESKVEEKFTCFLTHDIDELKTIWLQEGFHALKKKKVGSIFPQVMKKLNGSDVRSSMDSLREIESKNKIRSTFFFLVRKGNVKEFKNADYDITEKKITEMVNEIKNNENEIALHGSFFTHNSEKNLQSDREVLSSVTGEKNVSGNRFHYLCFDMNKTPQVLEDAEFEYDSTLGFAENIGFRNSYADPFYLFNWERETMSSVLEFPLTVMDVTFYFSQYMNTGQSESLGKVKELVDQIKKVNGCLVLNWHNTSYLKNKNSGWDIVLDNVIAYCKSNGGKFFTFEEYISKYVSGN